MKSPRLTLSDLKKSNVAHLNQKVFQEVEKPKKNKKSKYNNTKTEVDGIMFDSLKEAKRYKELRLLLKVGEIGLLKRQVEYELNPGGTYSLKYVSDFEYIITETGEHIVEDVKGYRTKEYLKKRRLMRKIHGIKIIEI